MALYKALAEYSKGSMAEYYRNIHYDEEKGMWLADHYRHDNQIGGEIVEEVEYIPEITDYEIEKIIKKFQKSSINKFYTNGARIYIISNEINKYNGYIRAYIDIPDIADKVVIYDKYKTNKNLYENNNIGRKGVIACSQENNVGKYKVNKYYSDNFFYDIDVVKGYDIRYDESLSDNDFIEEKTKEEANVLEQELEKYKTMANENSDKAYFVFLETEITRWNNNVETDKFFAKRKSIVFTCDLKNRKKILDNILAAYRYYNLDFYGTIFVYLNNYKNEIAGAVFDREKDKYTEKIAYITENENVVQL